MKFPRIRKLFFSHSAVWKYCIVEVFALLSERYNFVKMIATKIFVRTIFVENFTQNIFGHLKFFSKVHISRENREKVIQGPRFDPSTKQDCLEFCSRASINKILGNNHSLTRSLYISISCTDIDVGKSEHLRMQVCGRIRVLKRVELIQT